MQRTQLQVGETFSFVGIACQGGRVTEVLLEEVTVFCVD